MTIDPSKIPASLRSTPHWIVWARTERKGKPDKPPIDYRTGFAGDVTDPSVWMTFGQAMVEAQKYDGIGFAFTPSDDFAGIDLDHCIDDEGKIEPWAERIVDGMQSYTELSPSGTGLHILVKGQLPTNSRHKVGGLGTDGRGAIEIYDHARYFTITGDHWAGTPSEIQDRGEELTALYKEVFPEPVQDAKDRPIPKNVEMGDREILSRARRAWNGKNFRDLFDGGDLTKYHEDWSRADMALCSHLAFWCSGSAEAVDRLFRKSSLYREDKWDRRLGPNETYGSFTIGKVLGSMRAYYDPAFGQRKREPGDDGEETPPVFHRTDLGNAQRLIYKHGADLRYCHPWGKWLTWRGDRWQLDETGSVFRYARSVIQGIHEEADQEEDPALRAIMQNWALTCEAEKRINSMVAMARHEEGVPVLPGEFDAWSWLLNCPNGTLNLRTGHLNPHIRTDLFTKKTAVPYDAAATCPLWEACLEHLMSDDPEMVAFLRRAVGYTLTGSVREHALFFLYGRGRNGKSTFLNTLQFVFGDYGITVNADLLTAKNQDEHPTGVADLQGRRFVATIEMEDGRRMAESLVKSLTGGDRIRARRMRQDFYEFEPTHKLFLAANHKPTIRGTDDGIWRRIKLVPFKVQISDQDADKDLANKLKLEAPGILAWAVRGCLEWQAMGLAEPAIVSDAVADYREEMDTLAAFIQERLAVSPHAKCKAGELYRCYVDWAKETGNTQLSNNKFGRLLTERGFIRDNTNSTNWRLGIALLEETAAKSARF